MVAVPAAIPETVPPTTVADKLLLLQTPPVVVFDKTVVPPTQTASEPVITPAFVAGLTVSAFVARQPVLNT